MSLTALWIMLQHNKAVTWSVGPGSDSSYVLSK